MRMLQVQFLSAAPKFLARRHWISLFVYRNKGELWNRTKNLQLIREVASACNICDDRLTRYELDKEIPSMQTIMTLASFYGVEVSELLKTE